MKPLVLREIADELGLHESTISRVTTAKYMATPFGTFELKYFFGSSLNTEAPVQARLSRRLSSKPGDRRQCVEHCGARSDKPARVGRRCRKAAVGQSALAD